MFLSARSSYWWLVNQKLNSLSRVYPISTRLFCYVTRTFKRMSLRLFRFKISQFVPFWIKNPQNPLKICKNGTNCEILILCNRRLARLKVHVVEQKSLLLMGGNPTEKFNFWVISHLSNSRNKIKVIKT